MDQVTRLLMTLRLAEKKGVDVPIERVPPDTFGRAIARLFVTNDLFEEDENDQSEGSNPFEGE